MKKIVTTLLIVITTTLYSQNIEWETYLGGSNEDNAYSIAQTTDGGYIVAGSSASSDGDVGSNNGNIDVWIVKLTIAGDLVWETNLGGSGDDYTQSKVVQTTDGGYIVAGSSTSNNGDVGGNNGGWDYWIVKLDANGTLVWESNFGGTSDDKAYSIVQASDGGYVVSGSSKSNNGDVGGNNGSSDYWIIKIDTNGMLVWETNFGGSGFDSTYSIVQASDGGYVASGLTYSNDGDVGGNNGGVDYWVVKLDANGNLIWETNLGGTIADVGICISSSTDGGCVVGGHSFSNDGDVSGNNGNEDSWIVKLDASGTLVWETNLGGSLGDFTRDISQTTDGGYIMVGSSNSSDGDVGSNNGAFDYWIVKLDNNGMLVWETNLGGSVYDKGFSISQTSEAGYIVAGSSKSSDGDVGGNNGDFDSWIVKLENNLGTEDYLASKISLFPNPAITTITIANITEEISKIEIVDMQGRKVLSENNLVNNTINISNLQAATYIVKIYKGNTIFYKKIIKK